MGLIQWKKTARQQFLKWHAGKVKENYMLDFQKEFLDYCDSDVDILRRRCLELRKTISGNCRYRPFPVYNNSWCLYGYLQIKISAAKNYRCHKGRQKRNVQ